MLIISGESRVRLPVHLHRRVHHEDHRPGLVPAPERLPEERLEHPRLHHRHHRGRVHHHVHLGDRAVRCESLASFSSSATFEACVRGAQFTGKLFADIFIVHCLFEKDMV